MGAVASHVSAHVTSSWGEVAVVVAHATSVKVSAPIVVITASVVIVVIATRVSVVAGCSTIVPTLVSRRDILRECLEWVDMWGTEYSCWLLGVRLVFE